MRIAIMGTAPASRDMAPFDDKEWEIWACSIGNMNTLPRITRWFELHAIDAMLAPDLKKIVLPYFEWLKGRSEADREKGGFDVVMVEFNDYVPKAVPFPRGEMLAKFGHNWFTSSVAWMMALAIARMVETPGPHEIGLFGVEMAADMEHYTAQKAGCVRFIEIAQERGIKVVVPKESSLGIMTPLYGYAEGTPFGRRIQAVLGLVNGQLGNMEGMLRRMEQEVAYYKGAREQLMYFERTWTDGADLELNLGAQQEQDKRWVEEGLRAALAGRPSPLNLSRLPNLPPSPVVAPTPSVFAPSVAEIKPDPKPPSEATATADMIPVLKEWLTT